MDINRRIIHALVLLSILFLSLVAYLTYFELFTKDKIITNSYNRRQQEAEDKVLRGKIMDRNGNALALSEVKNNVQVRNYPFGPLYSQIIGYSSKTYGKSMLEAEFNDYLLGKSEFSAVFDLKDKLAGNTRAGYNISLTIDHKLQETANNLIGDRKGAVVAINPKTGEVLAMISKPDFDPSEQKLVENWKCMVESPEHPFLPRAMQGLYAPGSTYKVAISAAAIKNGMKDRIFKDDGEITVEGRKISNFGGEAHGQISLKTAFAVSSNVVFSQIGMNLGYDNLKDIAEHMELGKEIPFDLTISKSIFPYKNMSKADMAAVGIGQGKILITPLQMALIASAVANNGAMMKPMLVSKIETSSGIVIKSQQPSVLSQTIPQGIVPVLTDMMQGVVDSGTGRNAAIRGVAVAGKTGTAENELTGKEKNKEHAWFIGFAPANDPQIAVAVILEFSGSTGGDIAAPIARDVIYDWISRNR